MLGQTARLMKEGVLIIGDLRADPASPRPIVPLFLQPASNFPAETIISSSIFTVPSVHIMAETVGLASGLLTLASFAFQSSIKLYDAVKTFRSHQKRVRDLMDELEALIGVLGPLNETVAAASTDVDLSALDLPLLRCGSACKEFEQELMKCLARTGNSRTSFRDWARLRYMGDDIDGFRRLMASYKLTITIALADANL